MEKVFNMSQLFPDRINGITPEWMDLFYRFSDQRAFRRGDQQVTRTFWHLDGRYVQSGLIMRARDDGGMTRLIDDGQSLYGIVW